MKHAEVLPHALINNDRTKLGETAPVKGIRIVRGTASCACACGTIRAGFAHRRVRQPSTGFGQDNYRAIADYLPGWNRRAAFPLASKAHGPEERERQMTTCAS
jgi:hypothetical protein